MSINWFSLGPSNGEWTLHRQRRDFCLSCSIADRSAGGLEVFEPEESARRFAIARRAVETMDERHDCDIEVLLQCACNYMSVCFADMYS